MGARLFRFEHPDLGLADNVRLAARNELDRAIADVSETGFDIHGTVRNVRRRLKRVRSILRLIRPAFPDYATENAALRDIGSAYSGLRDAMARVEAVDRLVAGGRENVAGLTLLRRELAERAAAADAALDRDALLMALRSELREARVRAELWELSEEGAGALVPGFADTYRRGRRGYERARRRADEQSLHEWRKALKHHANQLKLLGGLMPVFAVGRVRAAQRLARMLGELQDLYVLGRVLGEASAGLSEDDRARIGERLEGEVVRLRRKALKRGKMLYAEPTRTVRQRWRTYWADWKAARRLG